MPPKRAAFLNNYSSENLHGDIPDQNLSFQNIIKEIYQEFTLVQTQLYKTEVLLKTQTRRLTKHIEAAEQQNWSLQKKIWSLESELASERQKGSENAEGL
ncbi:hypothetical protein N7523_010287 [Penicillium sp. IBT 18751x]|nr:hypothetical protein N7523_010287 [Penicillium sp. IBT 18751x]